MSDGTKWYDPICYQFSFYMLKGKTEPWNPIEATKSFLDDLIPYYHLWMALQGNVMVSRTTSTGTRIRIVKDFDTLHNCCDMLEQQSQNLHGFEISLVPDKTQSKFAVPVKALSKEWRQEVLKNTGLEDSIPLDASQKAVWLYQMINCPTDDLEGVCFPQRCFETKGIQLKISYARYDDPQTLLSHLDGTQRAGENLNGNESLHCVHISLPRCMLKHENQVFGFQHRWEERLLLLCNMYPSSFGSIKMDRYQTECVHPLLTGNGCFVPDFEMGIPDVAWGLCLEQRQAQCLVQLNKQCCVSIFNKVLPLDNGHLYLRLTPDVSVVPKLKAQEQWKLLSPHLHLTEHTINSVRDVPISFRLGIDSDHLQVDEHGYYRITR